MDSKEFKSLTLQRAALANHQVAGEGPATATELAQTVPGMDVTKEGVITHQAFTLEPPVLNPGQTKVTLVKASKANFDQAVHTLDLLDASKINVAPALVARGLQNAIHHDTQVEEFDLQEKMTDPEKLHDLVPVDLAGLPVEYYDWNPNYIILSQDVVIPRKTQPEEGGEVLEDSQLPATLNDNPTGELHGRHIVVIQANPVKAIAAGPEIVLGNPTPDQNMIIGASDQSDSSSLVTEEPKRDVYGGPNGMFVDKKPTFTLSPDFVGDLDKVS